MEVPTKCHIGAHEVSCGSRCECVGACVSYRAGVVPLFLLFRLFLCHIEYDCGPRRAFQLRLSSLRTKPAHKARAGQHAALSVQSAAAAAAMQHLEQQSASELSLKRALR